MEREDPLWEDNPTHRSCQVWSRQSYLWIMMILHIKNFYCKEIENELKSYHNKTDWANFVVMQDSWLQLKSDTLPRDEDSSKPKGWIRGNTKIGPVLEVTICCLQDKYGVEIGIKSVILTHVSEFLMVWINWSRTWTTRTKKTTSRKSQKCSSKNMR